VSARLAELIVPERADPRRPEATAFRVAEQQFADRSGHAFSLISGPPAIQRALEVCGLLGHLHLDAS